MNSAACYTLFRTMSGNFIWWQLSLFLREPPRSFEGLVQLFSLSVHPFEGFEEVNLFGGNFLFIFGVV